MKSVAGFIAGVALLLLPGLSWAQQCVPLPAGETVADVMLKEHGEHFLWRGQMKEGPYLEMYVNPETGKWTQLFLLPDQGAICFAASGAGPEMNPLPWRKGA